jgi:hypothetical protein
MQQYSHNSLHAFRQRVGLNITILFQVTVHIIMSQPP